MLLNNELDELKNYSVRKKRKRTFRVKSSELFSFSWKVGHYNALQYLNWICRVRLILSAMGFDKFFLYFEIANINRFPFPFQHAFQQKLIKRPTISRIFALIDLLFFFQCGLSWKWICQFSLHSRKIKLRPSDRRIRGKCQEIQRKTLGNLTIFFT